MKRKPTYCFDDLASLGIDEVPNEAKVVIKDNGSGGLREVLKVETTGLDATSTVGDFLANTGLYKEIVGGTGGGITSVVAGTNIVVDNTNPLVPVVSAPDALVAETVTTLSVNANILKYVDEDGVGTDINLSLYLDDTNLAYIVSGTVDVNGIATFTRDDATSFTVDMSVLLGGGITSVVAGENIVVDNADPLNPIVSTNSITRYTLTADTPIVVPTSTSGTIIIQQDTVGGHKVTWDNAFKFGGALLPILASGISETSVFSYATDASGNLITEFTSTLSAGDTATHKNMFFWDSQNGDTAITMDVDMEYSNDDGVTFNTLAAGTDVALISGTGGYILRTDNILTTFKFETHSANFDGNMTVTAKDLTDISYSFSGCHNLLLLDISAMELLNISSLKNTFYGMSSLTIPPSIDASNMSNITSLRYTFHTMSSITTPPDVSEWDTGSVTTFDSIFYGVSNITLPPDVSEWDTSSLTRMWFAFREMTNLNIAPNVSKWDTSNVTLISGALMDLPNLIIDDSCGIHLWDINSVTSATDFLNGTNVKTSTMDKILINWEAQTHQPNVIINFGTGNYTLGGAAEVAYNALVADGWVITGITGV